jgi:hypothetical protein
MLARELLLLLRRSLDWRSERKPMLDANPTEDHDNVPGDFGSHLQRCFGITSLELGECLTRYRPSRAYAIAVEGESRSVEQPAA